MTVKFQIAGNPKAKERPRLGYSKGKIYRFTPKTTRNYEKEVKKIYKKDAQKYFNEKTPLSVSITAFQERPKQNKDSKIYSISKPDLDNCAKIILDALNKVAYKDDSQVAHLECKKIYTDSEPYIDVKISELEGENETL